MVNQSQQPPAHYKDHVRGILLMAGGVALLLHTLGLLQKGLSVILIIVSLLAILYGFFTSGLYDLIQKISNKYSKNR
ncbi:MAG TPA: hypothetical protein VHA52_01900 [Candidatus Babeliaceae bacterium]|nr:hypothetical protein [Candidatus Babeliaceae bacterium]